MLSRQWLYSDYKIANLQYKEAKQRRDTHLQALALCYEALATGVVHGKEEHSMLVRVKELNGIIFNDSVLMAKLSIKMKQALKKETKR